MGVFAYCYADGIAIPVQTKRRVAQAQQRDAHQPEGAYGPFKLRKRRARRWERQSCIREALLTERATAYALAVFRRLGLRGFDLHAAATDAISTAWERLCGNANLPDRYLIRKAIATVIRDSYPHLRDRGETAEPKPVCEERIDPRAEREAAARADLHEYLESLQGHQRLVAVHLASGETIPETAAAVGTSQRSVNRIRAQLVAKYQR